MYTDRETAPLKFHTFYKYICLPFGCLYLIADMFQYKAIDFGPYNGIAVLGIIIDIALIIVSIICLCGLSKWEEYGRKCVYIRQWTAMGCSILAILFLFAIGLPIATTLWSNLVVNSVFGVCITIYYNKRKMLFYPQYVGNNTSMETIQDEPPSVVSAPEVSKKSITNEVTDAKIKYCRRCGKDLIEGSEFCRWCGTKVEKVQGETSQPIAKEPEKEETLKALAHFDKKTQELQLSIDTLEYDKTTTTYMQELHNLYNEGRFADVIKYGDTVCNKDTIQMGTDSSEFYCFSSQSKFLLYLWTLQDKLQKDLYWIDDRMSEVISIVGSAYIEIGDNNKAESYLEKASSMDPTNIYIHSEYVASLLKNKKLNEAEAALKGVFPYCVYPDEFATVYRNFGSIYIEKGLVDLAEVCYGWSMRFAPSDIAINEILYIETELKGRTDEEASVAVDKVANIMYQKMILDANSMPMKANDKLLEVLNVGEKKENKEAIALYKELGIA